jgi:hypothetical protein
VIKLHWGLWPVAHSQLSLSCRFLFSFVCQNTAFFFQLFLCKLIQNKPLLWGKFWLQAWKYTIFNLSFTCIWGSHINCMGIYSKKYSTQLRNQYFCQGDFVCVLCLGHDQYLYTTDQLLVTPPFQDGSDFKPNTRNYFVFVFCIVRVLCQTSSLPKFNTTMCDHMKKSGTKPHAFSAHKWNSTLLYSHSEQLPYVCVFFPGVWLWIFRNF